MNVADLKKQCETKMSKSLEALKHDLGKVRTGRAHAGILDHVMVDYYGAMVPIRQVANVNLADARTIMVQPFEKKLAHTVEKAIRDADLGLNPSTSGDTIRVPMPLLTEERRKELTKIVKVEGEHCKVAIRNIRRDANTTLKDALKDHAIPEDIEKKAQDDVQKLTDKFIAEVDKLIHEKEKDLMSM
ncbi:MAG TPA: ribosome recycling factor [Usitatibacteraceae bacterium]|nr:ribosome recycling factor [Usitatibacteraceae bacterium]